MIKDGKFVCSDFPPYKIEWGLLNPESEKKIKEWLDETGDVYDSHGNQIMKKGRKV